jgi:predicted DNA-binding transcriptional regulator AlpA
MRKDLPEVPTPLFTERQAAHYLVRSVSALRRARKNGTGPKFVKIGRSIRYLRDELNAYILECQTAGKTEVERG